MAILLRKTTQTHNRFYLIFMNLYLWLYITSFEKICFDDHGSLVSFRIANNTIL